MKLGIISIAFLLLFGINQDDNHKGSVNIDNISIMEKTIDNKLGCPVKISEYDPMVMVQDIKYNHDFSSDIGNLEHGEKIGEIMFKMNDMVCPGYIMKNWDATVASIGTPVYKVKGYSEKFRIFVGNDLYEVDENPNAKSIGELYDIKGKVKKISFESTEDSSHIADFSDEATTRFIEEFLRLDYVGFKEIYNSNKLNDDNQLFLRIYLYDGSSLQISYWIDQNIITPWTYASDVINSIVKNEFEKLKEDKSSQ